MQKKLRVACLHGYGTNAKFLSRQMRSFKRAFDREIQFVFLQGTFDAPKSFILDAKVISMIEGQTRSWNPTLNFKHSQVQYSKSLLEGIQKYFIDEQYDGIIGFSQGAVMTHFLVKLYHLGKIQWKGIKSLKFCILVCGNHWSWDKLGFDNNYPIELPSVHLISQVDFLYRKSIFTTAQFKDPLVIHHQSGHAFPRLGKEQIDMIKQFLKKATKHSGEKNKYLTNSKL